MTSLREQLNNLIRQRGSLTWLEIKAICETGKFGRIYKTSNAERRLRASESPNIETEMKDGHIIRYRWKGAPITYRQYFVTDHEGRKIKTLNLQV